MMSAELLVVQLTVTRGHHYTQEVEVDMEVEAAVAL